jgi:transglutaminase-like putative cysteine protease
LPARVRNLARDVAGGLGDDLARATALERHLRENYRYTFDTVGKDPAGDVADDLLFGRGEGHCEIFATTMAVMLRAANIPARLVTGYPATRYDLFIGEYEIRRLDGHAWVEAYIDGAGWVTFEPTPGYAIPPRESPRTIVQSMIEHLRHKITTDHVLRRVDWTTHLAEWFVRMWDEIKRLVALVVAALLTILREALLWLVVHFIDMLVFTVAVLASFYLFRRLAPGYTLWWWLERWHVARAAQDGPRAQVLACYAGVERLLARKGLPRPSAWTHRDYEARIGHQLGWLRTPVALLTNIFGIARYSMLDINQSQAQLAEKSFREIAMALRDLPPARREMKRN